MTEMTPEVPVELEIHYTFEDDVLVVELTYGKAKVVTTLDWSEGDADPGGDFNLLHAVLPTAIARTHQEVNGA